MALRYTQLFDLDMVAVGGGNIQIGAESAVAHGGTTGGFKLKTDVMEGAFRKFQCTAGTMK